jgi:hypothetical protein
MKTKRIGFRIAGVTLAAVASVSLSIAPAHAKTSHVSGKTSSGIHLLDSGWGPTAK